MKKSANQAPTPIVHEGIRESSPDPYCMLPNFSDNDPSNDKLGRVIPKNKYSIARTIDEIKRNYKEKGSVDLSLLALLGFIPIIGDLLSPDVIACSEIDCDGNGIPDYAEESKKQCSQ